ncbi:cytochrome P450 [Fomitiporia mediterranea MF3/22]|uniref:cytochrome P450 n=1 Tax=Fomitiporia mediterranea (strain MF3/22) TaxID=694068 RepID=UPI000440826D|nr:cytochrome P450 [Fomitiporia mediterranea MF3/22]EJD01468.1 cytochrome P450 [Fomitiporia mediterranea MF3/22]
MPSLRDTLVLDFVGALLVHAIYKRYEINPSRSIVTFLLLGGVPSICAFLLKAHIGSVIYAVPIAFAVFYTTLTTSVVLYRISPFHPLAGYPGPLLARISKLYCLVKMVSGKNHEWYKELHNKYGPYVRVGAYSGSPNEVSVVDADAISSILGSNGLPKGPMWDARRNPNGVCTLIAIRDPQEHARRRKPWNRAFNTTSVKGYEQILIRRALQLVGELEKRAQVKGGLLKSAVDLAEWMKFFTFDLMGDMAFGGGFETMRDGPEDVPIWHAIEGGVKGLGLLQHLPWALHLMYMLPGATKNLIVLRKHAIAAVRRRKREGSLSKDLFHHLVRLDFFAPSQVNVPTGVHKIDEDGVEKEKPTDAVVTSDAVLAVLAGTDTTATVLGGLFYNLLTHAEDLQRLRNEVDQVFPPGEGDATDISKLNGMEYLNAVINEALRICPPANVMQRGTTAETGGRYLGNKYAHPVISAVWFEAYQASKSTSFIPEGTAVDVPLYALFRDPRYFSPEPEEFWPDRWLNSNMKKRTPKQMEYSTEKSETETMALAAFIPFSYGPENCAGRALAMAELRMAVALLVQRFDMRFEEGYDPREWNDKLEDWFIMLTGKLPVVLTVRN